MVSRLLAFLVWALLAFSAAYWLLKLVVHPLPVPAQAQPAGDGAAARTDLSRLLGAAPSVAAAPVPEASSRFKLVGLVAPKKGAQGHEGEGVAVIAIDSAPPRSVRVGGLVDGELRLLALDARSASLGNQGVVSLRLELAPPAPAATSNTPPVGSSNLGGGMVPPPSPAALQGLTPMPGGPVAPGNGNPPGPNSVPLRDVPGGALTQ